jgi:hypothetical protein
LDAWDYPGRILGRPVWCHPHRNNHADVETDELGHQVVLPLYLLPRKSPLDRNILPLDIAEFAHALHEDLAMVV